MHNTSSDHPHRQAKRLSALASHIAKLAQEYGQAELLRQASHDALTGLRNRAAFEVDLAQASARAARLPDYPLALLNIDLDGFKQVNDRHGHPAGDQLLRQLARRLDDMKRQQDRLYRLGGDEFAWLAEDQSPAGVQALAQRIVAAIREPVALDAVSVTLGCSIGVSLLPLLAPDKETLVAQADRAMYQVKHGSKGDFCVYHASLDMDLER